MKKVLIVDDEQLTLDGLERILSKVSGLKVVEKLQNGLQAKRYLEEHSVDIVFTDIRMPVMDGLELAKWLHIFRPECSVILISAYKDFGYAQQAMSLGVKYYLTKPFRYPEVKKVVDQMFEDSIRREKAMLWNQDVNREMQELEMYHALLQRSNPIEKSLKKTLYYAEYIVRFPRNDFDRFYRNGDLLRVGLSNIFRWCAPMAIPVLKEQQNGNLQYVLLAEAVDQLPTTESLQEHVKALMEADVDISLIRCVDAKDVIANDSLDVAQNDVADEIIKKAKNYITQNLSLDISRLDVANAVHLEPSYFSKYFKKKVGMTFQDYLLQERIHKVMDLLEKDYKVQDAMKEAGFHNRNYFNQVFKKYTGGSPSEYKRESYKEEEVK